MLSRLVITFLPRSQRLLISWLQSPSAVILEPKKIKVIVIPGDLNSPLTAMDRSSRQKIKKATEILNDIAEHLDLIDIFRTLP